MTGVIQTQQEFQMNARKMMLMYAAFALAAGACLVLMLSG